MSRATSSIRSPTRHCQMAECSESMGRSQASAEAMGSLAPRSTQVSVARALGKRHDEVAAGDQRLLVGRGDDLAGLERGEDRAQADHAAGGDHDEVHVVARGHRQQRVRTSVRHRPGRQVEAREGGAIGQRHDPGADRRDLGREGGGVAAGGHGHDLEGGAECGQDVERLAPDGAGRTEQGDPRRPVSRGRQGPGCRSRRWARRR